MARKQVKYEVSQNETNLVGHMVEQSASISSVRVRSDGDAPKVKIYIIALGRKGYKFAFMWTYIFNY